MAIIKPFRALRYNSGSVKMDQVVAPPYDIISPAEQEALYGKSPYNIIRIEYGKEDASVKYQKASEFLNEWLRKQILEKDTKESFYLYETIFKDPESGRIKTRVVIFGLFQVEPFESKVILPHEKTHSGPKEDRFKLLSAIKTNISPVYGLYQDSERTAQELRKKFEKQKPLYEFKFSDGEAHKLWAVSDSSDKTQISKMFSDKQVLIADGHHRYETALRYSQEQAASRKLQAAGSKLQTSSLKPEAGSLQPSDYCLMGLVELEDEGLLIFPIHRQLKNIKKVSASELSQILSPLFDSRKISETEVKELAQGKIRDAFAVCFPGESILFKIKDIQKARAEMPAGKPDIWYRLEVAQVSHLVLKHLGVDDKNLEHFLEYTRFSDEALEGVRSKKFDAAVIVPPIEAKVMQAICASGELMPQKSTYFYPKLGSGFLMYRHE